MNTVFADTVYFLALLNPVDQWHVRARELSRKPPGTLLTTEFVLMEVVNRCVSGRCFGVSVNQCCGKLV
jgi:predicted nucleic acid-binding protein